MANNYVSQFTGDELDFAISSALGDKYRGNLSPGCHTIGASMDMQVNFDELTIPGKYTAYFYINGPVTLIGVSPVCIQVFWGASMLYQTIQVGARLFWRDLLSGSKEWKEVNLGVEATTIIDNLVTDLAVNDRASVMALSANMGAELRKRMENLQIGNVNLIDFSNVYDDYFHNVSDRWYIRNATIGNQILANFMASCYNGRFPMVDDVDREMVTVFSIAGNGACGIITDNSQNPIQMANQSMYTASVYVLCESFYFDSNGNFKYSKDNSPVVYLKIVNGSDALATIEKTLYQLFQEDYVTYTYDPGDEANGESGGKVAHHEESIGKSNGYVRLTVTYTSKGSGDNLGIEFGVTNSSEGELFEFVYPKVEYGQYATQYNHSWQDLYYFFNNCEEIYGRPINISDPSSHSAISEQSGLVFNSSTEEFDVEPVAVGGGGGFLQASPNVANSNPRKDKIIIFDPGYSVPASANYRIRGLKALINDAWTPLCNSPLTVATTSDGVQSDCGWLDSTKQTSSVPATLKYWDNTNKVWRPVGAMATEVWFMQQDVPTDASKFNLIWIKTDTRAPYIHIGDATTGKWVPLLALWGSPTT